MNFLEVRLGKFKVIELGLIDEWKSAWKMFSVWAMVILGAAPQIWDNAVTSGLVNSPLVPAKFQLMIGTISAIGVFSRLIKQQLVTMSQEVKTDIATAATVATAAPNLPPTVLIPQVQVVPTVQTPIVPQPVVQPVQPAPVTMVPVTPVPVVSPVLVQDAGQTAVAQSGIQVLQNTDQVTPVATPSVTTLPPAQ